jgi:hypothetical protein
MRKATGRQSWSGPQLLVQEIRLRVEVRQPRSMEQQIVNLIRDHDQFVGNLVLVMRAGSRATKDLNI